MTSSWSGKPIIPGEIPETVYRNTLDLNRFSNSVSKKLVLSYNRVILDAVKKLEAIEKMPRAKQPAYKAARLRSLLRQVKNSLDSWSNKSSDSIIKDLDGIAKLQSEFAMSQIAKALPSGVESVIHPINVSDSFAKSVVNTSPTQLNASLLSDDLKGKVTGRFSLTAKEGALINLPNGKSVRKSFRGLAASQADLFGKTVRDGMLTGETTPQIVSRLVGTLNFGQDSKSVKQIALAGGQATKMANHQIQTIVQSAVQQVSNTASQAVYKSNSDITNKYRYVATLDTRTSPICRDLDGQEFEYGKGPEPLQHFRCRSTTVAVLNYEKLGVPPPSKPLGKRASESGSVPAGTTYGKWLSQQPAGIKAEALGKSKVKYFNAMSKKYGPDQAIKKFVAKDGSEKTLKQLQKSYGTTPTTSKRLKKETIPRPKIAGPGTPPLRLTKKDPLIPTWDPDEALRKAQANSNKNYLGSGAFGSVYKLDGNPPTVIKKGQFGRHEIEALDKLKDTGIAPKVLGQKYTTKWEVPSGLPSHEYLKTREGTVVMTLAKGKPVGQLLEAGGPFGDFDNPKNLTQRDLMLDQYIKARKTIHTKGMSHNDMHADNFMFDPITNKGTVIDFGLAQMNKKSALIEAIGTGTGGDETGMITMLGMLGNRPQTAHKLFHKLSNNITDVKIELERRGKGKLAMDMLDWEAGMNFSKPKYAELTDDLADELLQIVYKGI
jgi:SPP1 gp7 family putative phage head morphogenesis protein